ncbi:MAG: hypothetical protein IJY35_01695 [Clostridia bacterium]|nr:hypothetical protein [Clostridia bacterium]
MGKAKTEIRVGDVVQSTDGRDRKRVFLVIELDETNPLAPVVIANGQLRKKADRKHKNPGHLRVIGALDKTDIQKPVENLSDGEIAEICQNHDFQ